MKRCFSILVLGMSVMVAAGVFAAPQVTLDCVQQRYPWNGLVDIDYTVSGIDGDSSSYAMTIDWASSAVGATGMATRFDNLAGCDLPTMNGTHRVTWNAAADGLQFLAKDLKVTVRLVYAPVTEGEADFLIVDLSSGKNSTEYPVRFARTGADYSTEQFNCHLYKQTRLVLRKVRAGSFWMGVGNVATGTKRHKVRLSKDYWMGIFEVTQRQYTLVYGSNPSRDTTDATTELAAERPVSQVNYDTIYTPTSGFLARLNDKVTYCGRKLGLFALPTEAQWERACRAGCENAYYWGEDTDANIDEYEWTKRNANSISHVVGLKKPNGWGFYDFLGNACEWVRDWEYPYPAYEAEGETVDPCGMHWQRRKIIRGGYWHSASGSRNCGTRNTDQTNPNVTSMGWNPPLFAVCGFRLCKEVK